MVARHLQTTGDAGERSRAVILLSGGLDSATVLAMALSEGYRVTTLSFDYGQRHRHELAAAAQLSERLGVSDHRLASVDSSIFYGATSLTLNNAGLLSVPKKNRRHGDLSSDTNLNDVINSNNNSVNNIEMATILPTTTTTSTLNNTIPTTTTSTSSSSSSPTTGADHHEITIPSTYVPARNTLFLSYALALAESVDASNIFIGANAVDYSGYPDCRPEFFRAFQRVADLGTKKGVTHNQHAPVVRVPLLHWSKREIIETGLRLGLDYAYTHSCYDPGPDGRPCTLCDACILRADAFAQLGFAVDPVVERFQRMDKEQEEKEDA